MRNWLKLGFLIKKKTCSKKGKGIPFVVTYHPILQALNDVIKRKLNQLYADNGVKNVFSPRPMLSFPSAGKINSCLVSAKVYTLERKIRSCGCGENGVRFALMLLKHSFTSTFTHKTYEINHLLNCSEKCLVYLLTCWVCLKQHIGQTVDKFRNRWSNCKSNDILIDSRTCKNRFFRKRFNNIY